MKKIILVCGLFFAFNSLLYAKEEANWIEIKDELLVKKIGQIIDKQVPELKTMANELLKNKKEKVYGDHEIRYKVVLPIKNYNQTLNRKNFYTVRKMVVTTQPNFLESNVSIIYISKDLKKVEMPSYNPEDRLKPISIAEWRKLVAQEEQAKKKKLVSQQTQLKDIEKVEKEILNQIKLDKKKELIGRTAEDISTEDLITYLKEIRPDIEISESYVKILKPDVKNSFKCVSVPNSSGKNELEKNYYMITQQYVNLNEKTEVYFIPKDFNEKNILTSTSIDGQIKHYSELQSIHKDSKMDSLAVQMTVYFKKHPEKKEKPDEEVKKKISLLLS